jgi:integrase
MFSFFTCGMSFVDLANLRKNNIKGNAIIYQRKKTGQTIKIELFDCMIEIIERYRDSNSDFLFPILRKFEKCCDFVKWQKSREALATYNRRLKKIAKLAGLSEHITSYVARHSWASIASQIGVPLSTISRGMGHESEKTTRIYISQLDFSDVTRANKQIFALLNALQENSYEENGSKQTISF